MMTIAVTETFMRLSQFRKRSDQRVVSHRQSPLNIRPHRLDLSYPARKSASAAEVAERTSRRAAAQVRVH